VDGLASAEPTPGGGAAAALAGALAAAAAEKVAVITARNEKFREFEPELRRKAEEFRSLRAHLFHLIREDSEAYRSFVASGKMPRETPEEKEARRIARENARMRSLLVPLDAMKQCLRILGLLEDLAEKGSPNLVSDAGVACHLAASAFESASLNVRINLRGVPDEEFRNEVERELSEMKARATALREAILAAVESALNR
jgi:formiminotetrahydrofolate cyclodeaminase